MKLREIIEELGRHKKSLFTKYAIRNLAIFGSVSRGDNSEKSDLDILVEFDQPIGIQFIDLADELEELLKVKVDLVSKNGIKARYFKQIEQDLSYV
jgi:uncharacterized protein